MKKYLIIILVAISANSYGQPSDGPVNKKSQLSTKLSPVVVNSAPGYFAGKQQPIDSIRSLYLTGLKYKNGDAAKADYEQAFIYLSQAAKADYAAAIFTLGDMYKLGLGRDIDFEKAFELYTKAADQNYPSALFAKGYMLYKGLGCKQDYEEAVTLFRKAVKKRNARAMRFLGLCMRNGYGTQMDKDSANFWLNKAVQYGDKLAIKELNTSEPENIHIADSLLASIQKIQNKVPVSIEVNKYRKIDNTISEKNIAGNYEGFLIKYDFSGEHIIHADKLTLILTSDHDSIKGSWIENDSMVFPLKATINADAIRFEKMSYFKKDHYYPVYPELLNFENASMQLLNGEEQAYLFGNVKMFRPDQKEPSQPLAVILSKKINGVATIQEKINAYPNPFTDILNIDFSISESSPVTTQLLTLNGKVVYTNSAGTLNKGNYTLPIKPQYLAPGTYILRLQHGSKSTTSKVIKM